jgi:hypothetical protein
MRYVTDYKSLSREFIESPDWDVIELKFTIDKDLAESYIKQLEDNLAHLCFSFESQEYIKPEIYESFVTKGRVGNYVGNVSAWTISWPENRDIPCPSKRQANLDKYPELKKYDLDLSVADFYYDCITQDVYKFGLLEKLDQKLTIQATRQLMVAKHFSGLRVMTHIDGPAKKIHIPLRTNSDAYFTFGDNAERKYNLEVGKAYLVNTNISHGTENLGDTARSHLLCRVDSDFLDDFIKIDGHIE